MGAGRTALRWLTAAFVGFVLLALINAYGHSVAVFVKDVWGPDFSYFDNGRTIQVKVHRIPSPDSPGQAPPGTPWPEKVLRPACYYTLSLMGLSGPEGGLWDASFRGQSLVVSATATGAEVGRYRVTEGAEETGLAVVELNAGPNGLHLMDVMQPVAGAGWFVVRVYRAPEGG